MSDLCKRILWYAAPYIALPILLIGVPLGELRRAWRGMHIISEYRYNLKLWQRERAMPYPGSKP